MKQIFFQKKKKSKQEITSTSVATKLKYALQIQMVPYKSNEKVFHASICFRSLRMYGRYQKSDYHIFIPYIFCTKLPHLIRKSLQFNNRNGSSFVESYWVSTVSPLYVVVVTILMSRCEVLLQKL